MSTLTRLVVGRDTDGYAVLGKRRQDEAARHWRHFSCAATMPVFVN